jgi:hypothetical protein
LLAEESAMTKRRAAWFGVGILGLVVLAAVILRMVTGETVTEENLRRVTDGMPLADVEALFGRPAEETTPCSFSSGESEAGFQAPLTSRLWVGRDCQAFVLFDADDRVVWAASLENNPLRWRERIARLLGF